MKLQTKCTLVIVGLFIIEILPVPVTSLYSLYAVRKRPDWLPRITHALYNDKLTETADENNQATLMAHDPMVVRKNCTVGLGVMFVIDLLVPVVIPTALYVVRRRPGWFKKLIHRLYSDKLGHHTPHQQHDGTPHHDPLMLARTEQKLAALEQQNLHFAKSRTRRHHHLPIRPK